MGDRDDPTMRQYMKNILAEIRNTSLAKQLYHQKLLYKKQAKAKLYLKQMGFK